MWEKTYVFYFLVNLIVWSLILAFYPWSEFTLGPLRLRRLLEWRWRLDIARLRGLFLVLFDPEPHQPRSLLDLFKLRIILSLGENGLLELLVDGSFQEDALFGAIYIEIWLRKSLFIDCCVVFRIRSLALRDIVGFVVLFEEIKLTLIESGKISLLQKFLVESAVHALVELDTRLRWGKLSSSCKSVQLRLLALLSEGVILQVLRGKISELSGKFHLVEQILLKDWILCCRAVRHIS